MSRIRLQAEDSFRCAMDVVVIEDNQLEIRRLLNIYVNCTMPHIKAAAAKKINELKAGKS